VRKNIVELRINEVLATSERDRLLHSIDERQFLALHHVLVEEMEEMTQQITTPENTPTQSAYYSGALGELRYLLARLLDLRKEGGEVKEEG